MDQSSENERALTATLRAVAIQDAASGPSASVEAHLLREVRHIARRRRRRYAAACAAALVIAAALPARWIMRNGFKPSAPTPIAGSSREVSTAFVPLPYSGVPISNGQLVRVAVPRGALASFDLAPADAIAFAYSEPVAADVLVGEDGLARAIRFVRSPLAATSQEQQP